MGAARPSRPLLPQVLAPVGAPARGCAQGAPPLFSRLHPHLAGLSGSLRIRGAAKGGEVSTSRSQQMWRTSRSRRVPTWPLPKATLVSGQWGQVLWSLCSPCPVPLPSSSLLTEHLLRASRQPLPSGAPARRQTATTAPCTAAAGWGAGSEWGACHNLGEPGSLSR